VNIENTPMLVSPIEIDRRRADIIEVAARSERRAKAD